MDPSRPAWKSSKACITSDLVFITNGPAMAMGSRIGWPPSTNTSSGAAGDVLVARMRQLVLTRQVHPQLHTVEQPTRLDEVLRRSLDVQDPGARGHPLRVSAADGATAAARILVLHDPVDHVGHRLESAVRMPRRSLRLTGCVFDLAHLIHMNERVEQGEVYTGECSPNRETLTLEPCGGRGDRPDRPGHRGGVGKG